MAYNYRKGAIGTFALEDGSPGPGKTMEYKATDGWKVEIQNEGCVEISQYGISNGAKPTVYPWHRIWQITASS